MASFWSPGIPCPKYEPRLAPLEDESGRDVPEAVNMLVLPAKLDLPVSDPERRGRVKEDLVYSEFVAVPVPEPQARLTKVPPKYSIDQPRDNLPAICEASALHWSGLDKSHGNDVLLPEKAARPLCSSRVGRRQWQYVVKHTEADIIEVDPKSRNLRKFSSHQRLKRDYQGPKKEKDDHAKFHQKRLVDWDIEDSVACYEGAEVFYEEAEEAAVAFYVTDSLLNQMLPTLLLPAKLDLPVFNPERRRRMKEELVCAEFVAVQVPMPRPRLSKVALRFSIDQPRLNLPAICEISALHWSALDKTDTSDVLLPLSEKAHQMFSSRVGRRQWQYVVRYTQVDIEVDPKSRNSRKFSSLQRLKRGYQGVKKEKGRRTKAQKKRIISNDAEEKGRSIKKEKGRSTKAHAKRIISKNVEEEKMSFCDED